MKDTSEAYWARGGFGRLANSVDEVPERCLRYAGMDAWLTLQAYEGLQVLARDGAAVCHQQIILHPKEQQVCMQVCGEHR